MPVKKLEQSRPYFYFYSSMSSNSLVLSAFLTRNFDDNSQDDTIFVRRVDDVFQVKYYDAIYGKTLTLLLSRYAFPTYVKQLCSLFVMDHIPFKQIQFNFHGYPTFMASHDTFQKNPELTATLAQIADVVSDSFFMDDDEMPPLIPIERSCDCVQVSFDEMGRRVVNSCNVQDTV